MSRPALLLMAFLFTSTPLIAQNGSETLGRREIEALVDFDFEVEDIAALVSQKKARIQLDAFDIKYFKKKGVSPKLLKWLETQRSENPSQELAAAEVVALWKAKSDENSLTKIIKQRGFDGKLGIDEVLILTKAKVPTSVLALIRTFKPQKSAADSVLPAANGTFDRNDVLKMVAGGTSSKEIIAAIKSADAKFDLDPAGVLQLRNDGVPMEVMREMYARRLMSKKPATSTAMTDSQPTSRPGNANETKVASSTVDKSLELFRPRDSRFSILAPRAFVRSEEFAGRKALVQMVEPSSSHAEDLPALELSILTVKPREGESDRLSAANLTAVAQRFIADLEKNFAKDGVKMTSRPATRIWLSGQRAARIETSSITAEGRSYRGAHLVMFGAGRVHVVSYSVSAELVSTWRAVLENCARSLSVRGAESAASVAAPEASDREALKTLFENWKKSITRFDYDLYRRLHGSDGSEQSEREQFLALAHSLARDKKRIELDVLDLDSKSLSYKIFGLDGAIRGELRFAKVASGWRLKQS
ncbi:MAG: hypothetical protein V3W41_09690 [Planctomycetota bacterium]